MAVITNALDEKDTIVKSPYIRQLFVSLHGNKKQSQKAPDREIEIAMRRMQEIMDEV